MFRSGEIHSTFVTFLGGLPNLSPTCFHHKIPFGEGATLHAISATSSKEGFLWCPRKKKLEMLPYFFSNAKKQKNEANKTSRVELPICVFSSYYIFREGKHFVCQKESLPTSFVFAQLMVIWRTKQFLIRT